jgi:hypothetical protein
MTTTPLSRVGQAHVRRCALIRAVPVVLTGLMLVSLSGCGANGSSETRAGVANEAEVNWDNPIDGQRANTVGDARVNVKFPVTEPTALGIPSAIYDIPASEGDEGAVDFIFDLPSGRVVVAEFPYDFPVAHWNDLVASVVQVSKQGEATPSPSSGEADVVSGFAESYTLQDGRIALITTSEDSLQSNIRWLSTAGVEIVIQGPQLKKVTAVLLANQVSPQV